MNVLVDTSVWVAHFKRRNNVLVDLLLMDRILVHPFVIGEIACGTPPAPRRDTINNLSLLRPSSVASATEVMDYIEREQLFGQGCGWVDVSLLASTLITPEATLWTLDKRLAALALHYGVQFTPASQD